MKILDRKNTCMFVLTLNSKLPFKRFKEAVEKLSFVYPGFVSENTLLFVENGKNCFLVYVFKEIQKDKVFIIPELFVKNHCKVKNGCVLFKGSDYNLAITLKNGFVVSSVLVSSDKEEESSYKKVIEGLTNAGRKDRGKLYSSKDGRRVLLKFLVWTFVLFFSGLFVFRVYNNKRISEQRRIQLLADSERKKQEELLKKQKELENLKAQYEKLIKDKPVKVKDALSIISACLDENSTVRSMTIDGALFSLEISGSDALKVYENFEKNPSVEHVALSRLGYENDKELSSFSGTLSHLAGSIDTQSMSMDEKISYVETIIENLESEKVLLSPSEYSLSVKTHLEKTGCTLVTLSRRESSDSSPLEVNFSCKSSSLIAFLDKMQSGENEMNISSFRLRNTDGSLLCTAVFEMPQTADIIKKGIGSTGNDERIDSMFTQKNENISPVVYSPVKVPSYSFVGKGKSNGVSFILIKTTDGKIVKLILSESIEEEGTCVQSESGYKVNYNGQISEVKI